MFNYYVAIHGAEFYGNLASSFSAELYLEFARRGKPAAFLNWAQARVCRWAEPKSTRRKRNKLAKDTHSCKSKLTG